MEVGNIAKAATFKSFLHLSYKSTNYFFCERELNLLQKYSLLKHASCPSFPDELSFTVLIYLSVDHCFNKFSFKGYHVSGAVKYYFIS